VPNLSPRSSKDEINGTNHQTASASPNGGGCKRQRLVCRFLRWTFFH
jgi:hypothetical protein